MEKKAGNHAKLTNFLKRLTHVDLGNNIFLSTRSCKINLALLIDDYWRSYRPTAPQDSNETVLTEKINTYYSDIRYNINKFDFSLLDDAYGSFILTLIK
jgi:hypothetical protein